MEQPGSTSCLLRVVTVWTQTGEREKTAANQHPSALMGSFVFLLFLLFLQSAAASEVISVKDGDHVVLPCQSHDGSISGVKWTRAAVRSEYVVFNRGGRSDTTKQHPYFEGRVQLVENDLKDGDASLILKNVNKNDGGAYECRVHQEGIGPDMKRVRTFRLEVTDSGEGHKQVELPACRDVPDRGVPAGDVVSRVLIHVVVIVGVVIVIFGGLTLLARSSKRHREQKSNAPDVVKLVNDE